MLWPDTHYDMDLQDIALRDISQPLKDKHCNDSTHVSFPTSRQASSLTAHGKPCFTFKFDLDASS